MAADTWESLLNKVNKRLEKQMSGPVAKTVKNQFQKNAQTMAAGEYSRASGGIADTSNFVSEVNRNGAEIELIVKNTAKPQDSVFGTPISGEETLFSTWVQGEWMDLKTYLDTGEKTKRTGRMFVEQTQQDVNGPLKGQIVSDLQKGFK